MRDSSKARSEAHDDATGRILDSVRWDYDPEEEELSPLVSTERYFRDFPWDGVEEVEASD